jgi:hypothetical protein
MNHLGQALCPKMLLWVLALTALVPAGACSGASPAGAVPAGEGTVLIELFTSQGCSSCPPADRLLTRLAEDPRYAGRVVPLAFHVDYWNHLGWSDPFSSAGWSRRQQEYAASFHSRRIYTPQLVVGGTVDANGSDERAVRAAIDRALSREPAGKLELRVDPVAGGKVKVHLEAEGRAGRDAWVALYQSGLSTPVGAGENARATLHNDRVVRQLVKAFSLSGGTVARGAGDLVLEVPAGSPTAGLGVAAFLQDPGSRAVEVAVSRPVAPRAAR